MLLLKDMEELRASFMNKYANLPFGAREEIIAVVGDIPFTWNSAMIEIKDNLTPTGDKILRQLNDLKIL